MATNSIGFKLRGIPVAISPGFFLMCIALYVSSGGAISLFGVLQWFAVVMISVLAHEYGHAMVARMNRLYVDRIDLNWHGGMCLAQKTSLPMVDMRVALAGPAAGFALAAVAWTASWFLPFAILGQLVSVNILWSIINLIPFPGLDGRKVLDSWQAAQRYGR